MMMFSTSDAFERQYPHQVERVVTHVDAFGSAEPLWNPEQPEQPHHMVDAERSAGANHLSDTLAIQPVAVFPVLRSIRRRKGPVLTIRREVVGRSAYAAALDIKFAVGPEIRTAAIGRNG